LKHTEKELPELGFHLLSELEHSALGPFVHHWFWKRNFTSLFFWTCQVLFLFWAVGTAMVQPGGFHWSNTFSGFSFACALAFLLIPLHEGIHMMAYKLMGARQTRMVAHWKRFYFLAIADGFVANRSEFRIVALAPFVVISLLLSLLSVGLGPMAALSLRFALFVHAAFCSGDFALLSYFESHKDREMLTVDDFQAGISRFWIRSRRA
jgi:hypothetical protein